MIDDLGPSTDLMLSNLRPVWKTLSINLASLSHVAQATHNRTKQHGARAGGEFDRIYFNFGHLHSLLGERPTAMGIQSIFEALTTMLGEIDGLRSGSNKIMNDALLALKTSLHNNLSLVLGKVVATEVQSQVGKFVATEVQSQVGKLVATEVHSRVFSRQSAFFQLFIMQTAALLRVCSS